MDYFGMFFAEIPRAEVPYDYNTLENFDMLENSFGQQLLYFKDRKYYIFMNNDVTKFISKDQMFSPWKKL